MVHFVKDSKYKLFYLQNNEAFLYPAISLQVANTFWLALTLFIWR